MISDLSPAGRLVTELGIVTGSLLRKHGREPCAARGIGLACLTVMIGWPEIIGILVVVLLLFGARKVPELARGLGQGIREFKKASREFEVEIEKAMDQEAVPTGTKSAKITATQDAPQTSHHGG